jgi:hypothetical protein
LYDKLILTRLSLQRLGIAYDWPEVVPGPLQEVLHVVAVGDEAVVRLGHVIIAGFTFG